MIKKLTLVAIASLVIGSASTTFAAADFFGNGFVVLNLNGTGNTFFDLQPPTNTANPDFSGSLGTFNPSLGDSLILNGAEFNTFQDGGDNVSSVELNYAVYTGSPTFSSISIDFVPPQNGNDKFWQTTNSNVNLLASLAPGTYNFQVFGSASTTAGPRFYSDGGNNYTATFTVVPEPSTLTLLAGPALLGGWFFLRRRRAS